MTDFSDSLQNFEPFKFNLYWLELFWIELFDHLTVCKQMTDVSDT